MKKKILLVGALLMGAYTFAQAPQKMSYQSVVRNASNNLVSNSSVGVRISILQGSASGTAEYVETHTVTTNTNGLATLEIGSGTVVSGTMAGIDWSNGPYFIKTETDPTGGTNYTITGTSELMSVPYALYAANSAPGPTGPQGPAGTNGTDGNGIASTIDNGDGTFTFNYTDGSSFTTSDLTGPTGAAGANGTNGTNGVGITSTVDNGNGTFTINYSDGSSFTTSDLTGPTGATGATGATGPAGPIAGSDTQIIYNNAGSAAGSANNTWNESTTTHTVTGTSVTTNERITALGGGGTRYVTADNSGNLNAVAFPGLTGSGGTNYHAKFTGSTTLGNSLIQDNGTSVSVNFSPQSAYQFYVYRQQQTINGDGQHTIFGQRDRNSQNDGTGYSQAFSNSGVMGQNFWGDVYTFGTSGFNYNDFTRTGGILGAEINGNYWGSLGYKNSSSVTFGVYGSNAFGSGGGLLPSTELNGFGGGFFGGIAGSVNKGDLIGTMNAGELFSTYNSGNTYTYGKNVELVGNNEAQKTPVYAVTAVDAKIYNNGIAQLVNGEAFIAFDAAYQSLLGDNPVVTVTPNGNCNGVYIASVDKNGFTVRELNNGHSNVAISWISVGNRIDNRMDAATRMVSAPDFDRNLQQVLFNDGNTEGKAMGIWWDGSEIRFGELPKHLSTVIRPETNKK